MTINNLQSQIAKYGCKFELAKNEVTIYTPSGTHNIHVFGSDATEDELIERAMEYVQEYIENTVFSLLGKTKDELIQLCLSCAPYYLVEHDFDDDKFYRESTYILTNLILKSLNIDWLSGELAKLQDHDTVGFDDSAGDLS